MLAIIGGPFRTTLSTSPSSAKSPPRTCLDGARSFFGIAPCEQRHTGTMGRLELGLQANIPGETQSPTDLAGYGKIRLSFRNGADLQGGAQEHRTGPYFSSLCSWVPFRRC